MTSIVHALVLACSAPIVDPAPARGSDLLVFAPKEGTRLDKTLTMQHHLVLQKMEAGTANFGGLSQVQLDLDSKVELRVSDHYRKVGAGQVLELQRLYPSCDFHVDLVMTDGQGEKRPEAWDADTPLKGKSVVFTWVPEEKGYSRYYDQAEALEEYLASLSEDLDLGALLPLREVHVGESWAVDPARLVDVFVAGGNIPMGYVRGARSPLVTAVAAGVGGPLFEVFGGTVKGNVKANWTETRDSENGRLAKIELSITIETDHDRTESMRTPSRQDDEEVRPTVGRANSKWKFEGSGTLEWNLGAGRFETLELVGREDVTSDIEFVRGTDTSRQLITMAGGLSLSAKAVPKGK